ncbi:MAG: RDD family protein [Burkholderiales bacterium]|nr:RDD family protein [Burkholderiales bacterium]
MPVGPTPSLARRLASMLYEALLLAAIAFVATSVFQLAAGTPHIDGWRRLLLQAFLLLVFAAYFLWCWLRGGQTLAMKAWRIRLVAPGHERLPPARAFVRFACASAWVGAFLASLAAALAYRAPLLALAAFAIAGVGLGWALVDRDGQFLHDRLAGTRLELVARPDARAPQPQTPAGPAG